MKRTFSLVLSLIFLLIFCSACTEVLPVEQSTTGLTDTAFAPADTTEKPEEAETAAPVPQISLVLDGESDYRLVRSRDADTVTLNLLIDIRRKLQEKTGVSLQIATDHEAAEGEVADRYEIVFGHTVYPESSAALAQAEGDYIITFVGNKLVINGSGPSALAHAADAFLAMLDTGITDRNFSLPADFSLSGRIDLGDSPLALLPPYDGGFIRDFCEIGDDNFLLIFDDTDEDEYRAYAEKLSAAGYTLYTENQVPNGIFSTYISEKETLTLGYYAYNHSVRIILGPRGGLPILEEENVYTVETTPKMAQLGLETDSDHKNGMSYIFQLSDGSFLVIDGGFNRAHDAEQLLDFMFTHAPNPRKITVAAWIITHSDGDHLGGFRAFVNLYGSNNRISIEQVIAALPGEKIFPEGTNMSSHLTAFANAMAALDGTEFVRAHIGQKFFFRDAVLEMLYTVEALAPEIYPYNNMTSLIFSFKIAGQTFLFTGDATNEGMDIALRLFGDKLKSDFVQTAHHGYNTGGNGYTAVMRVYSQAAPSVVLWPVGMADYPHLSTDFIYNTHLINLPSVKEIIVAGNRDVLLHLPYTYGTSGSDTILD